MGSRGAGYGQQRGGGGQGHRSYWPGQGSGQNAAHNPYVVQMPRFLEPIGETDDVEDQSIIVVDTRDDRMVSPFQTWLVSEIMSNAASSINVLIERDQVMPPSSGYHIALFANYTLDGIKALGHLDRVRDRQHLCSVGCRCCSCIVPSSIPAIFMAYVEGRLSILYGHQVETQFVDEYFVREVNKGTPRLSVVVAVFVGWRVSVMSFECGGRTYALAPGGAVVAGDSARSRFERKVCSRLSNDAVGNDADRLEFRYRDANNRIDLKCSRTSVPGTWLTVSHISGPTLIRTINSVRENRARVEGPEQTEQFAQLAAVHEVWWKTSVAQDADSGLPGCLCGRPGGRQFSCPGSIKAPSPSQGAGGGSVVEVRRQTGLELNQRAFSDRTISLLSGRGAGVHVEDAGRDRARDDRRFARSTAGLTPAIFAEEMQRRICNATTAVIEEVDTIDHADLPNIVQGRSGRGDEVQSSAAAQGPGTYRPPKPA
eukprot:s708_g7.t1